MLELVIERIDLLLNLCFNEHNMRRGTNKLQENKRNKAKLIINTDSIFQHFRSFLFHVYLFFQGIEDL